MLIYLYDEKNPKLLFICVEYKGDGLTFVSSSGVALYGWLGSKQQLTN